MKDRRRFTSHISAGTALNLRSDHPAVVEGRTLFPSTVVAPENSPRLLVSGHNSRKIGDRVTKGEWAGFPIFTLTLEERATCPKTCHHWSSCYGNSMHFARRHKHGEALEQRLIQELQEKQRKYPKGFVVRLHVLGDFYSQQYVSLWQTALLLFPALHVFGYTAHNRYSPIGSRIFELSQFHWDRFAIRFSERSIRPQGAITVFRIPEKLEDAIICPAQQDKTDCCGTCGLCWASAAKGKTIAFIAHGKRQKISKKPSNPA